MSTAIASARSSSSSSSTSSCASVLSHVNFVSVLEECKSRGANHESMIQQLETCAGSCQDLANEFVNLIKELSDFPDDEKSVIMRKFAVALQANDSHSSTDEFADNTRSVVNGFSGALTGLLDLQSNYHQMTDFLQTVKNTSAEDRLQVDTDYAEWAKKHAEEYTQAQLRQSERTEAQTRVRTLKNTILQAANLSQDQQPQHAQSAASSSSSSSSSSSASSAENANVLSAPVPQDHIDVITRQPIEDPARSVSCGHLYSRRSILDYIKQERDADGADSSFKVKCPFNGCEKRIDEHSIRTESAFQPRSRTLRGKQKTEKSGKTQAEAEGEHEDEEEGKSSSQQGDHEEGKQSHQGINSQISSSASSPLRLSQVRIKSEPR